MLNLMTTTDKLQVITGQAVTTDVHASFVDVDQATGAVFTPSRQNTAITTATTTDVVAAPGAGVVRNVKHVQIRNKHASSSVDVTVQVNVSATLYELIKCTLLAGEALVWHEGTWFHFDSSAGVYATGLNIGGLPAVTAFLDADEFPVNEAGVIKKVSGTLLSAWMGDRAQNQSTAAQSPAAATLTYLTGSAIAIPIGKLRAGTWFRWVMDVTKTAAGSAARTFHVRLGLNGTTADAAIHTITSVAGTAVADTGVIMIETTVRGPLSASCISRAVYRLDHNLAATGFSTLNPEVVANTSGVFDATTANLIIGLSVTTGAAEVITFQQIHAEAKNL